MSIKKPQKKLYYSLRQTTEMAGVSNDTLKSWEQHFSQLSPSRDRSGNRHYTEKEIAIILMIKRLVVDQELDLDDASSQLAEQLRSGGVDEIIKLRQGLAEVKLELKEILDLLQ